MLLRLALRPDRAAVVAAVGLAAGILLPVLGSLVLANLGSSPEGPWIASAHAGQSLDVQKASRAPVWVLAQDGDDASRVAYVKAPKTPPAPPPGVTVVKATDLQDPRPVLALFAGPIRLPDAYVAPARGADAFEQAAQESLQNQGLLLVALSIPGVALIGTALASQEARARRHQAATLATLGAPGRAFLLLASRIVLAIALGAIAATAIGFVFYQYGPRLFHPEDAPRRLLAIAIVAPAAAAAAAGLARAWWLRAKPNDNTAGPSGEPDIQIAAPLSVRPLLLGLRPLGILVLAGFLFAADVGFPIAAAGIPASLAGAKDEWVFGDAIVAGNGVDGSFARVAAQSPAITDALAESIAATLVNGQPVIVRGGPWPALSTYHGLTLDGRAPQGTDIVLGAALARRLDVGLGDRVVAHGADSPDRIELTVSAIARQGLLDQEAFVDAATGQRLAGLKDQEVTLLHIRPATQAALAAAQQDRAEIRVTAVTIFPPAPAAGSLARVHIDLVNLGDRDGQRTLAVRLNGDSIAYLDARVPGHDFQRRSVDFVVPAGALQVEVNPTAQATPSPSAYRWVAPASTEIGRPFAVQLLHDDQPAPGREVGLFRDAGAAESGQATQRRTTNGNGTVQFEIPSAGSWLVGQAGGPWVQVQATSPGGTIVVQALWTQPAQITLNTVMTLYAQVTNTASTTQTTTLPVQAGGRPVATTTVQLDAGESRLLSWPLLLTQSVAKISVGNTSLPLQDVRIEGGTVPNNRDPADQANTGEHAQAAVADRALGNAKAALVGLAGTAAATTLAVLALTIRRTLAGRQHVLNLLGVLGWDANRIRQRAAAEGLALGCIAGALALLPAKLLFITLGRWGPIVFAHNLPDPITGLFALQTLVSFGGICALAAYFEASRA